MAHSCSNYVRFEASPETMLILQCMFTEMAAQEEREQTYQLPPAVKGKGEEMYNIYWEEQGLSYETRWSPNTASMIALAEIYGFSFIHTYEELGSRVFGETTYGNGIFRNIELDFEDFDRYEFDEQTSLYQFEGQGYESIAEILELLIQRKKQNIKQN